MHMFEFLDRRDMLPPRISSERRLQGGRHPPPPFSALRCQLVRKNCAVEPPIVLKLPQRETKFSAATPISITSHLLLATFIFFPRSETSYTFERGFKTTAQCAGGLAGGATGAPIEGSFNFILALSALRCSRFRASSNSCIG